MTRAGALDLLRPFLWLALAAFLVGFAGYLTLGQGRSSSAPGKAQARMEAVSGPSSDDWNLPKHI
jgi:hypothetical protein